MDTLIILCLGKVVTKLMSIKRVLPPIKTNQNLSDVGGSVPAMSRLRRRQSVTALISPVPFLPGPGFSY